MPVSLHSNRPNKKVGLRPPIRATRFRAKIEYIPPARQKQDTAPDPCLYFVEARFRQIPGSSRNIVPRLMVKTFQPSPVRQS